MKQTATETLMQVSSGATYGVAAGVFMGVQLDTWMFAGTGVLVVLNIIYTSVRLYGQYKERRNAD